MPIKYIGRTNDFCGKTLWEILGNLRNHGIGRLVYRNMHKHFDEPCFYRILNVQVLPQKKGAERKVRAFVESVFRGIRYPKVIEMESITYKADFRLVPKHEEAALLKAVDEIKFQQRVLPSSIDFPPLVKYMLQEEMKLNKTVGPLLPKLKLVINSTGYNKTYRLAEEGEEPNVSFAETKHPDLYEITPEERAMYK